MARDRLEQRRLSVWDAYFKHMIYEAETIVDEDKEQESI